MCPSLLPSTPRKARIKRAQEKQATHTPRVIFSSPHARKACSEFPFAFMQREQGKQYVSSPPSPTPRKARIQRAQERQAPFTDT
mmetsp:Transcript_6806/g.16553  ORF Transcript_6806/g.16553 Transcript_6806/m.16553 type:complete len:84 (-) Transcript_6806:615-866(-)